MIGDMDRVTVQVDMCYTESTLVGAIANVESTFGVLLKVVRENGPTGPWPVLSMSGPRANVERALTQGWDFSPDEIKEYFEL